MFTLRGIKFVFCISVFLIPFILDTESKWVEDTINAEGNWVFITRFCFLSKIGKLVYYLRYPVAYGEQNLVFYYDVPGQWDSVYNRDLTCEEKMDVLGGRNQFSLTEKSKMCAKQTIGGIEHYVCQGAMDFSSARERWWFVVVSRCGQAADISKNGINIYYKLHMTNGDDLLHQEYSADEFYILVVDIIFFILYFKLMVLSIICAVVLKKRQLLHTTYKIYMVAVTIWTVHLFCMVIAWGYYGTTGWEVTQLEVCGRILQTASTIIFILMLILMAKGYTVVRGRLTNKAMVKITVFINLYIIATVILFIWEGVLFDPGYVLYYYECPPGYGLITVILIGWLWFTKAAVFTLKHYKSKTYFYIALYTIYSIWFWAGPVVILIAMFAMAKWTREKTVNGVQQFIAYIGHLIFLILTLPHKVNDNFPYHIRTTQIGAMSGDNEDDSHTDNPYAIATGDTYSGVGPNLELFITSKGKLSDDRTEATYKPLDPTHYSESQRNVTHTFGALPPIHSKGSGDRSTNRKNSNSFNTTTVSTISNNGIDILGPRYNHPLCLIQDTEATEAGTEMILPPIRGTGLPSIIPHVPPEHSASVFEDGPPRNPVDIFTVKNSHC